MADRAYHNLKPRVMLFAMFSARNIIKQDLQARGIKLSHVDPREVTEAAKRYLAAHPELLAEAEETVQLARRSREAVLPEALSNLRRYAPRARR